MKRRFDFLPSRAHRHRHWRPRGISRPAWLLTGEYEVAPKLKGSKDEIQKALQSGGAKANVKGKSQRKD